MSATVTTGSRSIYRARKDHPNNYCWYCGIRLQREDQGAPDFRTNDHVLPRSRGGGARNNMVPCCQRCNQNKDDLTLDEFREALGGGLFWGEVYATRSIAWTGLRAPSAKVFGRWLDMQKTVGANDWMEKCRGAANARKVDLNYEDRILITEGGSSKEDDIRRLVRLIERRAGHIVTEARPLIARITRDPAPPRTLWEAVRSWWKNRTPTGPAP